MNLIKNKEISLSGSRALAEASGDDLRVLLLLLENGSLSGDALASAAGCSPRRAEAARSYWREAEILVPEQTAPTDDGIYTRLGEELAELVSRHEARPLLEECQLILGHTMNQTEINTVMGLVEDYCVEDSFVLALFAYCKEMGKCSVRYVEKTALSLIDSGIDTVGALDAYIQKKRLTAPKEREVQRIFGISDRPLSKNEKKAIEKWVLYGYAEDVISLAYDITVDATGKALLPYADKVLSHWHAAGCRTLSECVAFLEKERTQRAARYTERKTGGKAASNKPKEIQSFDTDDFFQKALTRSYGSKKEDTK